MKPEVQDFTDQAAWCRASVESVAEMLPADDAELDTWIAETTRDINSLGFMFLVYAALSRDRPVQARHLVGGARLIIAPAYLPPIAFRVAGDMPECMLEGLRNTVVYHETEALALATVVIWCDEHRGGVYPYELLPQARSLARHAKGITEVNGYLLSLALRANDELLLRILRQNHPMLSNEAWEDLVRKTRKSAQDKKPVSLSPVLEIVPETPTYALDPSRTIRRAVARIGRNDPCHCGSGKKYKNCHYESDRERLQDSSGVTGHTRREVNEAPEQYLTFERLDKSAAVDIARWNPLLVPRPLMTEYFMRLSFFSLDRAAESIEKLGYAADLEDSWVFIMWLAVRQGRKDVGDRLMKLRESEGLKEDELRLSQRLLLAQDDPGKCVQLIEEAARNLLEEDAPDELSELAYSVAFSKFSALGILLYRSVLPLMAPEKAEQRYEQMQIIRERLRLPPEDPIYKFVQANMATAWEDAERALREAEEKFEAKRREVRTLKESLDQAEKEVARQERSRPAGPLASPSGGPENEEALRGLRQKVKYLEASIKEKNDERNTLEREVGALQTKVDGLEKRAQLTTPAPENATGTDYEDDLLSSQEAEANHPLRLIEFPRNFHERLNDFPHHVARAAMVMLGRLAAGDPAAFNGAKRLKSRPNVVRQRIGIDFRLLFRLLPDRIQVIDLIPRQDFERKIKTLL
jgi:hypothetical protein